MRLPGPAVLLAGVLVAAFAIDQGPLAWSQLRRRPPVRPEPRYYPPDLLPGPVLPDTSAAIDQYIAGHLDELVTPEFIGRKRSRREFQRAGYAATLDALLALDPLGALLSYLKTRLHIEYSLPHNTVYFMDRTGTLWPLPEDWTFPADPWKE